jgi:hypothetical protein
LREAPWTVGLLEFGEGTGGGSIGTFYQDVLISDFRDWSFFVVFEVVETCSSFYGPLLLRLWCHIGVSIG